MLVDAQVCMMNSLLPSKIRPSLYFPAIAQRSNAIERGNHFITNLPPVSKGIRAFASEPGG